MLKYIMIAVVVLLCVNTTNAQIKPLADTAVVIFNDTFPKPVGYINDYDSLLTKAEIEDLAEIVINHQRKRGDQIVVATITSIYPYQNLYDYSLSLANHWGVGSKETNNGITIVFYRAGKEMRIQNGDGVMLRLTNAETQRIMDEVMIPHFRTGQYYTGIRAGLVEMIKELE